MDAKNQFTLLLKTGNSQNTDFYTFRYLASQGFLPGYNFPRLPLMAWVPATGRKRSTRSSRACLHMSAMYSADTPSDRIDTGSLAAGAAAGGQAVSLFRIGLIMCGQFHRDL